MGFHESCSGFFVVNLFVFLTKQDYYNSRTFNAVSFSVPNLESTLKTVNASGVGGARGLQGGSLFAEVDEDRTLGKIPAPGRK